MQRPPTVTFRGLDASPALEVDIRERIDKLETYYDGITGCHVLVELAHRHHEIGNRYHVRIDLDVPGERLVVAHDAGLHMTAESIDAQKLTRQTETDPERKHAHVAVREAFDAARRRLQDYARRRRGTVKVSARPPLGRVVRLFPTDEFGYLEADDGHEVFFHKGAVLKNGFERLAVGSSVAFVEEAGEKGAQASTVRLVHPRHKRQLRPVVQAARDGG